MGTCDPLLGTSDDPAKRTSGLAASSSQVQPQPRSAASDGYGHGSASQALETFPLRNTSDAIRLLDHAEAPSDGRAQSVLDDRPGSVQNWQGPTPDVAAALSGFSSPPTFFLLQEGLIDISTLWGLFKVYLSSVHPVMPVMPYTRIPITQDQLVAMASREPYLISAAVVVTAALTGDQALHLRLWQRVQNLFAEIAIQGANASIDAVEGLLLLSGTLMSIVIQYKATW